MSVAPDAGLSEPKHEAPVVRSAQATVARNTAFVMIAQVLGMPLTMTMNAVMARKLGPEEFGFIYLAGTLCSLGFLVVEWGQNSTIPAIAARDRSLAGALLGTGLVWRLGSSIFVYGVLFVTAVVLDYGTDFQGVLLLIAIDRVIGTICAAWLDTARGFEQSAPTAYSLVRYNLLSAGLVIPTLLLGGKLLGVLIALLVANSINTTLVWRGLRNIGIGRLSVDRGTLRTLLSMGTSFMFLSLALMLQPNVDAVFLSKLGTPEAVGWHAAARKLVGVLVFPTTALISALYPTLCRLHAEDRAAYRKLVAGALRTSVILVVPMAVGTALYPELGIMIFSEESFGPAADNLRILSIFVLLLYFTMVLGSSIAAAGRQKIWTFTQFACVAVSAIIDPLLIPWFQEKTGNGGLGVCVSTVISEVLMIVCGILIIEKGVFDRALLRGIGLAFVAGAAMAGVARILSFTSPFIGAPVSVIVFGGTLWLLGGLDKEALALIKTIIARKTGRGAPT